jgi:hypothetical protein
VIYIYSSTKSSAAYELVRACDGTRLRNFDGMDFWIGSKRVEFTEADIVVPWGSRLPDMDGVRVCNYHKPFTRNWSLTYLQRMGMSTVPIFSYQFDRTAVPRLEGSVGGNDLLNPPSPKDAHYYTQMVPLTKVYRVHSFAGKSIRAGVKVIREGFKLASPGKWELSSRLAHPTIMTYEAGWRVNYDFSSTKALRTIAHKAVKSLGLTFAAVDIGEKSDGLLLIIKVDPSPRIEGGTVIAYAKSLQKWALSTEGEKLAAVSMPDEGNEEIVRLEEPDPRRAAVAYRTTASEAWAYTSRPDTYVAEEPEPFFEDEEED